MVTRGHTDTNGPSRITLKVVTEVVALHYLRLRRRFTLLSSYGRPVGKLYNKPVFLEYPSLLRHFTLKTGLTW